MDTIKVSITEVSSYKVDMDTTIMRFTVLDIESNKSDVFFLEQKKATGMGFGEDSKGKVVELKLDGIIKRRVVSANFTGETLKTTLVKSKE